MSKIIKFCFEANIFICRLTMVMLGPLLFTLAMHLFIKALYVPASVMMVIALFCIPFSLINAGLVKYKGMYTMPLDLSLYRFNRNLSFIKDLHLSDSEADIVDGLFLTKMKDKADKGELLGLARKLATEEEFDSRLYLALIGRTILAMGEMRSGNEKNIQSNLKDKIEEIKRKLKTSPQIKSRLSDDEEGKDSDGKYGFL